ncbi:MAG: hypothetical protein K6G81_13040 [Lachnospiraceae bacterium]|nr:hypothetical protein [Lachnospiraceae bacterium]
MIRGSLRSAVARMVVAVVIMVMAAGHVGAGAASKKAVTVSTKKKLLSAVAKKDITTVTFKTDKKMELSIPKRENAAGKKLVADAASADITNRSRFGSIVITGAASYTEAVSGNSITVKDKDAAVNIAKGKEAGKITFATKKAGLTLNSKASAKEVQCKKKGAIISVDAGVKSSADITLVYKTDINVSGDKSAEIRIMNKAKGSTVRTSIPVKISAAKDMKVELLAGAEGTVIDKVSADIRVEIIGNIDPIITVNGKTGQGDQGNISDDTGSPKDDKDDSGRTPVSGQSGTDGSTGQGESNSPAGEKTQDDNGLSVSDIHLSRNLIPDYDNAYLEVKNRSYLYEYDGSFFRAESEFDGSSASLYLEEYGPDWSLKDTKVLRFEDMFFGGIYIGKTYNFVAIGQYNEDEDDSRMVMRLIRYDKKWKQCGQVDLCGANTIKVFRYGGVCFAEKGDLLFIYTGHGRYRIADGFSHQSNMLVTVDMEKMAITWAGYGYQPGYVSHAFDEGVLVDDSGRLVTINRGDCYPRGIVVNILEFNKEGTDVAGNKEYIVQDIAPYVVEDRLESTGSRLGGFAEIEEGYVAAYSYDGIGGQGSTQSDMIRDLYITLLSKKDNEDNERVTGTRIRYDKDKGLTAGNPQIVSAGKKSGGYVLWEEGAVSDFYVSKNITEKTVNYVRYYADGSVSEIKTFKGNLSDCKPIYVDGRVYWYVTNDSIPKIYILDPSEGTVTVKTVCSTEEKVQETKASSRQAETFMSRHNLVPEEKVDPATGRPVRIMYKKPDGQTYSKLEYEYDSTGNVTGGTYEILAENYELYPKYHFKYSYGTDGTRYISENTYYEAEESGAYLEKHYDEKGNVTYQKEWWYESDIEVTFIEEDMFDKDGNLVEEKDTRIDPDESEEAHRFYENGDLKRVIITVIKDNGGDVIKTVEYREIENEKMVSSRKEVFGDED